MSAPPYIKLDRTHVFANLVAETDRAGIVYKNLVGETAAMMDSISKDSFGAVTASLLEAHGVPVSTSSVVAQDVIDTINNYHIPAAASLTASVLAKLNNG